LLRGKSTKTAATRATLFDSNMHQIVCRLGELTALPRDPLAVFRGPTSKGTGDRGGEGERRGGRGEEGEGEEDRGGEGRERVRTLP